MPHSIRRINWPLALSLVALGVAVYTTAAPAHSARTVASRSNKNQHTVAGRVYVTNSVDASDGTPIQARCPKGTHVVGGGQGATDEAGDVNEGSPYDGDDQDHAPDDGWRAYFNDTGNVGFISATAICE